MDYLQMLGEKREEKDLTRLLVGRDGPNPYNADLNPRGYLHFLKIFSVDRDERTDDYHSRGYSLLYRNDDYNLKGWEESFKIERMLTMLLTPPETMEQVLARQNLLKRYIASYTGEEDSDLAQFTRDLIASHYSLYAHIPSDISDLTLEKIAKPFVRTVESLVRFRARFAQEKGLEYFTQRLTQIFEDNPITRIAALLEQGGVLVIGTDGRAILADRKAKQEGRLRREIEERQKNPYGFRERNSDHTKSDGSEFWLARSAPTGKGIFDLGLFRPGEGAKMKDYPNQEKDMSDIVGFCYDSALLVYTLGAIAYQAEVFNRRRKLGLPVCIPTLNDEGRFRIKNGHPIATNVMEKAVMLNLNYDRAHRKFIIGGAHSGGKTELLKNIGLYTLVGTCGGIWPAEQGEVPLTRRIVTSIRKDTEDEKGALESELKATMQMAREMGEGDLALIDEFLDTTKPELARHISQPILAGEKGICVGFARSPGTVYIVDHRAPSLSETMGFEFIYPVLERKKASDLAEARKKMLRYEGQEDSEMSLYESLGDETVLIPTHTFEVGKPSPEEVKEHALMMWRRVLWDNKQGRGDLGPSRGRYEQYSPEGDDRPRKRDDEQREGYITWHVPGKFGGIWINNPRTNLGVDTGGEDEARGTDEEPSDGAEEPENPWEGDEVVLEDEQIKRLEKPKGKLVEGELALEYRGTPEPPRDDDGVFDNPEPHVEDQFIDDLPF